MPNHVQNTLSVCGDSEIVSLLDHAVSSDERPFDFQRIVPHPAIVAELLSLDIASGAQADQSGRNWRDWQIEHWGTKWNAYEFTECGPGRYTFLTAWASPIPVVDELSKLFPELELFLEFTVEAEPEIHQMEFSGG